MDQELRKVAILVDSLDSDSAAALMERFSADESARILEARVHLRDVPATERAEVIRQFYSENGGDAAPASESPGLETTVALNLLSAHAPDDILAATGQPDSTPQPFAFLDDADAAVVARHLADQPSRNVAVVLCHMAPEQSAQVLKRLTERKQIDVVFQMSAIEDLSTEGVHDVEQSLRALLNDNEPSPGFGAALSMIQAVDSPVRAELIQQLQSQHHDLANKLLSSMQQDPATDPGRLTSDADGADRQVEPETDLRFEDLAQLDGPSLARLIEEADPQEVLLAFTGAASWMVDRLLTHLPPRDAAVLRRKMDQCGPLALRDIELAQNKLIALAGNLSAEGVISPPPRRPFTSVA